MNRSSLLRCTALTALTVLNFATDLRASPIQSLMVIPDRDVLSDDFSTDHILQKGTWQPRQSTRWIIRNGVLHGEPSTPEFQKSRKDHHGYEPRLMILGIPQEYVVSFSFRINSGKQTKLGAFFEFGHHMARVSMKEDGIVLTMGGLDKPETMQTVPGFHLETGRWYHVLGELKGDELVVQIQDGPTLYARHPIVAQKKDGFGICGLQHGDMDIDDVTIRTVKAETRKEWPQARQDLALRDTH